jgi:IS5 family transposase
MDDLIGFALNKKYKRLQSVGDKLAEIKSLIDWKPFRPILESMYNYRMASGGRPEADVIVMFKMLVMQQCFGLLYILGIFFFGLSLTWSGIHYEIE